ncbi:MAG: hypothetical protein RLZ70_1351, partial [Verrucomicrobiota bacterium]
LGIDAEALKAQVAKGLGDGEILTWMLANAKHPRAGYEIAAFSAFHEQRAPSAPGGRERLTHYQSSTPAGAKREDITSCGSTSSTSMTTRASAVRSDLP